MKKICALIISTILLVGVGQANNKISAQLLIQQTIVHLLERLDAERDKLEKDNKYVHTVIEEIILPVLDIQRFSRLVLGVHWNTASDSQKQDFVKVFQPMLIKSYGDLLLFVRDVEVENDQVSQNKNKKVQLVKTKVRLSDTSNSTSIMYILINDEVEGWKIVDIVAEGSRISAQLGRGFDIEIRELGLNALIERLRTFNS